MLNAIKKLKLSPEEEQAYREWLAARERYRAECSLFQRIRKQIPRSLEDCNSTQIVLLERAKAQYKRECKLYYEAQQRYDSLRSAISPAAINDAGPDVVLAAVEQFVQSIISGQVRASTLGRAAEEELAAKERFGPIEQSSALSAIAEAARSHVSVVSGEEAALAAELEVTEEIEDFETPPEALVPPASPTPPSEE